MEMENSAALPFKSFCKLCNKIAAAPKPVKVEMLSDFFTNLKVKKYSYYPVMRLLIPQLDRNRSAYGIKEHTLAKIYVRILCLPQNGIDAIKLMNYRTPKAGASAGDFAEVAFWTLKKRCGEGGELNIDDINQGLDEIALKHAEHDPRGVDAEFTTLVQATSPEEQKWLIRIILKDMKLGIGQAAILNALHPDAREYYDVTNSLEKVCNELRDPEKRLNEIEISLFDPFRPMLSEELDVKKLDVHLNRCPHLYVETKMDGERFQIHMENGKFKYFSRRAFDYTDNYGENSFVGMLTPRLAQQISTTVKSVIFDGEMMCWNTRKQTFTTKGMEIDVKKLNESHVHRPCFCPFDVLYLNGETLTNKPLYTRLEILENIVTPKLGVISLVARHRITTKEQVWDALNKAIDSCEEGIILKEYQSVYKPNARKNGGWYKLKPEYCDGLMDTLDLLIVGGYHGEGRFGGTISQFLLAVKHHDSFWSTVRVGCGLSMEQLGKLQKKLEPHWKPYGTITPANVKWTREKPEMWIEPVHSVLLEVKASEIVPSDAYRTGFTLRFPRVINIRYDKPWSDACTFDDFEVKRKNYSGKLTAHGLTEEETSAAPLKRRTNETAMKLADHFKATDTTDVVVVSNLLAGKEICVMDGYLNMTREDIEKRIVRFGGKVVQNPGADTWCVLCEQEKIRVRNVMSRGIHDVIKCSWLVPLLSRQTECLPATPRHGYLGLSRLTASTLCRRYDQYGDHFTAPATETSLRQCMELAQKMSVPTLTDDQMAELDIELFSGSNRFSIFRSLVLATPQLITPAPEMDLKNKVAIQLAAINFMLYGGQQAVRLGCFSHVICPRDDEIVERFKEYRRCSSSKFHIITTEWIEQSITQQRLLPEHSFAL